MSYKTTYGVPKNIYKGAKATNIHFSSKNDGRQTKEKKINILPIINLIRMNYHILPCTKISIYNQVVWDSVARSSFQERTGEYWVRFPGETTIGQCACLYA